MAEITIASARGDAAAACLALLPDLASPDAVLFEARDGDGILVAAGGLVWKSWDGSGAMPAWITVLPDARRMGVGRALIDTLAACAAEEGADLIAARPVDEESDEASFAVATGCTPFRRHHFFEADARDFLQVIAPLVDRLKNRSRVPADARVVPLSSVPIDEVKWLVAREMTTAPPVVAHILANVSASPSGDGIDYARSCALIVGDTVAGALLSQRIAGRNASSVICNVIDPRWRGGWANAVLLDRFARTSIADGCFRIAFDCDETVRDTIGLATRSKADRLAVRTRYRYAAVTAANVRRR